jgi:rSAM/selenodomain-associated transferase 2
MAPELSVIIPVLNEADRVCECVRQTLAIGGDTEILVVDGGSRDDTVHAAESCGGVRVLRTSSGRAMQMNAGARLARADTLLFLHADVRLPSDALEWIRGALADETVVAGAFRTWTVAGDLPAPRSWLKPLLHLADLRSRLSRRPYGDQALFVRTHIFRRVGGFPEVPIMEDYLLARRLSQLGTIRIVPASVEVSGRRFLERPVYYTLLINAMPVLLRLGVSPQTLKRYYPDVR